MLFEGVLPADWHDERRDSGGVEVRKGGADMSIRDWIGGILWAIPMLVAVEYLTR